MRKATVERHLLRAFRPEQAPQMAGRHGDAFKVAAAVASALVYNGHVTVEIRPSDNIYYPFAINPLLAPAIDFVDLGADVSGIRCCLLHEFAEIGLVVFKAFR